MAYEFSFDGKSLWALGGGSVVLCLLVFFAGVLLGANWGAQDPAQAADGPARPAAQPAQSATAPPAAGATVAALPYAPPPQGPVVYDLPAPQGYAAQGYAAPGYAAQDYAAQGYGGRAPAWPDGAQQQRYAPPPAAAGAAARDEAHAPAADLGRESARLSSAGADADPRLVSEADNAAAEEPARSPAGYAVQVGAYPDEGEARRLAGDLENKGYTPTLYRGRDGRGHPWYAVRIGAYSNQREAAAAAENFARQEQMKAAVRPSNSL